MNIKVKNADLLKNLKAKDELVKEGRALSVQIEELEAKRNKCGMQIQKFKDKIIPVAEKLVASSLGEFGVLTTITIEGDEVRLDYIDQVEEFKKMLLEKKNAPKDTPNKL